MYNEFNQHKKSDAIKWAVVFILIAVLFAGMIAALVMAVPGKENTSEDQEITDVQGDGDKLSVIPQNTEVMTLRVSEPYYMASPLAVNGYTKSVDLTATIFPEEVADKTVDWYIEWSDSQASGTVTDYVTVTPASDGALKATVTCYQPFDGDIVVTVVTRSGKKSATCLVSYVGAPETLRITANGISTTSHASIGAYYKLPTGSTYTFTLSGENGFNDVRTDCNYTYSVRAYGNIITADRKYNGLTDTNTFVDGTEATLAINDITKVSNYIPYVFAYSISGNTLSIESNATLTSYYSSSQRSGQMVTYYDSFKAYEDDNWYYELTVTESNSGATQKIRFRPEVSVSSVTLNNVKIGF